MLQQNFLPFAITLRAGPFLEPALSSPGVASAHFVRRKIQRSEFMSLA